MGVDSHGRVLIVEDDPQVRELFTSFLEDEYDVQTAATGEEALSTVSDDVDVILLDRLLPRSSGGEVLEEVRERSLDCRVAMVTAVEPDLDIVELGFDDYVVKPVSESELHNIVDSLLHWEQYDAIIREYFRAARRVTVLEEELDADTLAESEEYERLLEELEALQAESEETLEAVDTVNLDRIPGVTDVEEHDDASDSAVPPRS